MLLAAKITAEIVLKRGTGGDTGAVGAHYIQYQKDRPVEQH